MAGEVSKIISFVIPYFGGSSRLSRKIYNPEKGYLPKL